MLIPKTPGVYIQEISKLPASVAPVATAIPAFIGYTEKNEHQGVTIPLNTPTRITSLPEYEERFGGAFDELLTVTLTGPSTLATDTSIAVAMTGDRSPYSLYYHLVMYFANGGGPCYIVPVGNYVSTPSSTDITRVALKAGLDALEQEDEVTLLVAPEASVLGSSDFLAINDALLAQCNKLQDRFAIMDAKELGGTTFDDAVGFRADVGADNLKYGAAYYPSLRTLLTMNYADTGVAITDSRTGATFNGGNLAIVHAGTAAVAATGTITITNVGVLSTDTISVNGTDYVEGTDFSVSGGPATTAQALLDAMDAAPHPDFTISRAGAVLTITATTAGTAGNSIALGYTDSGSGVGATVSAANLEGGLDAVSADKTLYNNINTAIEKAFKVDLYPAATIAGVYARVDNNRGVWKAPANVSVSQVREPNILVTSEEQEAFNVDATSGKSINVIRKFAGKGSIVWGSRTLAGNDNEWRYVPVRRLFIFMEESIKKATEFVVFEPNTAKTWLRTKTMIENFLTGLWRDGALAGAVPADAFFVKVGLGETMTSLDILEGRMNIEIGVAAVRPAEFIILKFSHKLQES